ncbi:toxin YoeB [Promicromonospora umidemergens]|uniref:Endoribonuclease YoeB n=1 Tax=Promicromonospora umidemergens TaxID=629679 RepID=A0ABP8XXH7_9MICO|nr:Txe/YoeB family addiction module toxin [Promicromonospora umidemergens]MCP2284303.1 toxin YoeB [Promicromonospora umidemergens]
MNIVFHTLAWEDYCYWQATDKTLKRINLLIKDITRDDPFEGIGKPEQLKANLTGYWSRRITDEHRLVYAVKGEDLVIVQARYHYSS